MRSGRGALGFAIVCAVLGVATPAAAAPSRVGFNNNAVVESQITAPQSAELLADAGAQVDRVAVSWRRLEPSPGDFRFEKLDAIYAADLARGIRPLFTFAYAPAWASGGACAQVGACHAPPTPDHYDDAARAAAAIAARYPRAAGIEIWNEPNTPYFWGGKPDPDAYAALLIECADAIHAAVRSMDVVGPATASGPGSLLTGKIDGAHFLGAIFLAGAGTALDAISLHAYPRQSDPSVDVAVEQVDRMRLVRDWFGAEATPLWITETGVTTSGPQPVTEAEQARRLGELDRRLRRAPDVRLFLVHTLVEPARDPATAEPGYGVVTRYFRRKPAYCTLAVAWGGTANC